MITGLPPTPLVASGGGVFASTGSSLSFTQTATGVTVTPVLGSAITIPAASDTLAGMLDAARATTIDTLATVASSGKYSDLVSPPDRHAFFSLIFDGNGAALAAGPVRYFLAPFAATITGWAMCADQSGSITVDIWKLASASAYPPTVANSITGGSPPTMSSASFAQATVVPPAWTTSAILVGDALAFKLSAAATCTFCTFQLVMTH